ncbi:hypothetical protein Sango_2500200 [Sesamum angolense]|uniref:Integrase zinc-binding domain-containing protein n=1 Tax=Sesamum angolense TaxID=2727404 RepID=A0AAE1W3W8_9LAMI|nr:hypothetical protein Sango_2500200 [Sesamum angolense]
MAGAPLEEASKEEKWLLHVDRSSTTQGSGLGILPYNTSQAKIPLEHTSDISNRRLEDSHAPMTGRGTPHQKLWEAARYFLPTMKQDARQLVDKCKKCQKHSSLIHQSVEPLTTMLSPCPFAQWGMDIVGPFPLALGQRIFL